MRTAYVRVRTHIGLVYGLIPHFSKVINVHNKLSNKRAWKSYELSFCIFSENPRLNKRKRGLGSVDEHSRECHWYGSAAGVPFWCYTGGGIRALGGVGGNMGQTFLLKPRS